MNTQITFTPDHDRMIKAFAHKVQRRANAGGAKSLLFADIYQELCVAWCKARDSWKAEYNTAFTTYLFRGMQLHVNRWVQGEITEGHAVSLDAEKDDAASLHSAIPDRSERADDLLERKDTRERVMARLTPRTRLFVELLDTQPQFLLDAVRQYEGYRLVAKGAGRQIAAPKGVTTSMALDFMEASRSERAKIYAELALVTERFTSKDK